ncbi:MAG: DHHA1 domain-containing protein [Pyrinomonadaceae bacterium]|nr:DHHA1 domain-containing protein [Pyrinomonadaceae bacterium]
MVDTGDLPNTSDRTLKVASELIKAGAKPAKIGEAVYANYPWSRIELMRQVLDTVKRDSSGRIGILRQTIAMKDLAHAIDGDNNGFVNIPLAARDVQASIYIREIGENVFRVSLRSKGDINVAKVAESFGGGGHKNAAGLGIEGTWDEVELKLTTAVQAAMRSADNGSGH